MASTRSHTRAYLWTASILLALLGLTVGLAHLPLGPVAAIVALSIAIAKATLVALVFMHLNVARPVTRLFAGAALFWLLLLIGLTLSDILTRAT